jgi:hypothetical protein
VREGLWLAVTMGDHVQVADKTENGEIESMKKNNNNNISSLEVIILVAAVVFVVTASIVATIITEVQAVKGEAAQHISTQGAANQSPKGAAASGSGCGDQFCG